MMLTIVFSGFLPKLKTPEIIKCNRSENGKGTDYSKDFVEVTCNSCFATTRGYNL